MSRNPTTTSNLPGDDDASIEARLIDAALAQVDAGQDFAPGENVYDQIVAAATLAMVPPAAVRPDLAARIAAVGIEQVRRQKSAGRSLRLPGGAGVSGHVNWPAWAGWAVAAAACVALAVTALRTPPPTSAPPPVVQRPVDPTPPTPITLTPAAARQQLLAAPPSDLVKAEWSPGNTPDQVQGDVIWSDTQQRGFLRFAGLPRNDPEQWVYQLWIFDANGDDRYPVDGGVFSVTRTDPQTGEAIIEIDPKIRVGKGVMFAVTIEKPGGVVVSDRSKIVALAKV